MLHYLTTSQVLPTNSALHRLDPRTRLLGFVVLLALLVSMNHLTPAFLILGSLGSLILLARVPWRYALRGLWLALPWITLIALIQLLFGIGNAPGCAPVVEGLPIGVTVCTLEFAVLTLLRFASLVLLLGLFTWTTPIPSLVRAIEALAHPFDRLGLPAHELALVGVIAVRFVPTMALELERLEKAQAARGATRRDQRKGFLARVRHTLPLIVPLFVLALQRAERLAEAMEARAYSGGRDRGHYGQLRFRWTDGLALGLLVLFTIFVFIV